MRPAITHSRRALLAAMAAIAASGIAAHRSRASAQAAAPGSAPAPLPDLVIGNADAPITIEEYASLTCGHCGNFHNNVLPYLKETYLDTGKAKLIYRDFPLDDMAVAAAMLARCSNDKRADMLGALFKTQRTWLAEGANPLDELYKIGRQFGMKQDEMETCLGNEALAKTILTEAEKFEAAAKIEGTPTFVINGKKFDQEATPAGFDSVLKPLVK